MKITDKIVTQVGQPSMTNVVWHNPDTNELKIYGKNGWETVGGSPDSGASDGSSTTSGYPIKIIDINETNTCYVDPNVFYKIKHQGRFTLMFTSEAEYYNQSGDFAVFTAESADESVAAYIQLLTGGGLLVEDTSLEGYSYKMLMNVDGVDVSIYFSQNPNENSTCTIYVPNVYYNGEIVVPTFTTEIYNITRLNNQGFVYNINFMGISLNTWFIQTESTVEGIYAYIPMNPVLQQFGNVFTDVPIEEATKVYLSDEIAEVVGFSEISITKILSYKEVTETCEYIFEVNTPCEIQTLHSFYWNNGNIPDLTQSGILTISIIGGHACYTFKPTT